ncbi:MAG: hypothetical protein IKA10_07185 [Oscillospiraceae bacterium]|nr:hypothetical protein [Oscillospiraceae bacterium]
MTLTNETTAKRIVMRRLFKQDSDNIINCYKKYDRLYYNPVNEKFIYDVLLYGEIWGAFKDGKMIACCYFFPAESDFFKDSNTFSSLSDFIADPSGYMYMGYIGTDFRHLSDDEKQFFRDEMSAPNGLYTAFLNVVYMQTFRQGLKYILHSIPLKMCYGLEPLFSAGYTMIKLRGLDNLVVHYIFAKAVFPCENIYCTDAGCESRNVKAKDTKAISALLEGGYCCVDIIKEKCGDTFMLRKLITD